MNAITFTYGCVVLHEEGVDNYHHGLIREIKNRLAAEKDIPVSDITVEFTGEVDNVSDEDIEAASEWFDRLVEKNKSV